jgi:hypothetical protein
MDATSLIITLKYLKIILSYKVNLYSSIWTASASVINPIVVICGITKYRRYILSKLTCGLLGRPNNTRVSPSNGLSLATAQQQASQQIA